MTPADLAELKARVEAALAESVKELGPVERPAKAVQRITFPIERAWALANIADTRAILTDRVIKALGGKDLKVEVSDEEIVVSYGIVAVEATVAVTPPKPVAPKPEPVAAPSQP